jgi:hypothetical protein
MLLRKQNDQQVHKLQGLGAEADFLLLLSQVSMQIQCIRPILEDIHVRFSFHLLSLQSEAFNSASVLACRRNHITNGLHPVF